MAATKVAEPALDASALPSGTTVARLYEPVVGVRVTATVVRAIAAATSILVIVVHPDVVRSRLVGVSPLSPNVCRCRRVADVAPYVHVLSTFGRCRHTLCHCRT